MTKPYTKEQIEAKLKEILVNDFEIDEKKIVPSANIFQDLEFDSIDAVDLATRFHSFTEKKLSPEKFKQIRTIEDIVNAIYDLI